MKNTRKFTIYIFLLSVVLFLGETECRGGRGGGGGGRGGGGRGGGRSSRGRSGSRSYGGAGGTSSGSSSGSAYWIFLFPAVAVFVVILVMCVACIQRQKAKPTFRSVTNNNSKGFGKNAYNASVQNNFRYGQESQVAGCKLGTYGYNKTVQNNLRIPECKVAMPLSGESRYKLSTNNVYLPPPVHGSVKPAHYLNSKKPVQKKPDVFIL